MKWDDNLIETALIYLKNGDWTSFHETVKVMSEEEKAHIENQMDIEQELNYESWVKEHEVPAPHDSQNDEAQTYEGTNDK